MAKRKRDPNRDRRPKVNFSYHVISRDRHGIYHLPPDLPADALPLPFQGEVMTCVLCGRKEQSDPAVKSQWRAISHDGGKRYYFCPAEFPPDGSPGEAFEVALEIVIFAMLAREMHDDYILAQARELRRLCPW